MSKAIILLYLRSKTKLDLFHWRKTRLLLYTLSWRKILNVSLIISSFHISRLFKRVIHWGNPMKIGFEPTTSCNLRCPECPSGLRSFTRPTGMLAMDLYHKVLDELHPDLVYLLLYFQGEPYLNRNLFEMAAYAKQKGIYSATSTNGHYLTPDNAKKTVESGLSEVIVSIDGTTQETYASYRIGGKLSRVLEGVKNLIHAREEAGSLHPYVVIQFLVVKPNEHQVEDIQRLGKELGVDKVVLKTAQIYDYADGHELIPRQTKYSRYRQRSDGQYELKNSLDNQCWKLWHGAEVTWDGKVLPCCFDKDADHEMGNLASQPFHDIWRGNAYDAFRGQLLQSRKEIDICRNCSEGTQVWA